MLTVNLFDNCSCGTHFSWWNSRTTTSCTPGLLRRTFPD